MNLKYYYWVFDKIIPDRICDEIKRLGITLESGLALTGGMEHGNLDIDKIKELKKKRDSHIVWLDERWIYELIQPCVNIANKNAGWNFMWDYSEHPQFTKYGKGQYYGWHADGSPQPYNSPGHPTHNKIRKLSTVLSLCNKSEYTGGELEIYPRQTDPDKKIPKNDIIQVKEMGHKGSVVVFPSFVWHRIKPVTKGLRYSVPNWHLGSPWQ